LDHLVEFHAQHLAHPHPLKSLPIIRQLISWMLPIGAGSPKKKNLFNPSSTSNIAFNTWIKHSAHFGLNFSCRPF
jgi:hypothetical protein